MRNHMVFYAAPWTLLLLVSVCSTHASPAKQLQPLAVSAVSNKDTPGLHSVLHSPENTAVVVGDRTSFVCISNTSFLNWAKAGQGDTYEFIASSCMLNQDMAGIYDLENIGVGRCDLVVLKAKSEDAGMYLCMETIGFDRFHTAQLAVIDAEPDCRIDNEDPRINDNVTLTCDVSYTDNISPVVMTWKDEQGRVVSSSSSKTSRAVHTTSTSSFTFTVTSYGALPQYTCTTKFSDPVGLPSSATNTPTWSYNWTSPALVVKASGTPQNTAGVVGDSIKFACQKVTQEIIWNFVPVNQTSAIAIAIGCKLAPNMAEKYRLESEDGACHLLIDSLSSDHAGTYTCQDFMTDLKPASAELIVLESEPICSSENEQRREDQQLTCRVTYSGNFVPVMTWTDETGAVLLSTTGTTRTLVVSRVTVSPEVVQVVTSTTHFEKPPVDQPGHADPATNAPDYTYSWSATTKALGDCSEYRRNNPDAKSGVYAILISSLGRSIDVYCDMDTEGGGWTVFQRRQDGSVEFYRDWASYVQGFGNLDEEFWLGNDNLAALTSQKQYVLRVDLENWSNSRRYALYSDFKILGAAEKYRLSSIGTFSGTAGDGLDWHRGKAFTTYDQNNDGGSYNCAVLSLGAWWYNFDVFCHYSNLNGEYNNTQFDRGVNWYTFMGSTSSLKFTEMKLRPGNF